MSSTRSSHPSSDRAAHYAAVRKVVAARKGREWCLFLDRDGVINRQVVGDYVRSWHQFEWLPRAQLALFKLRAWAPHLVVVTNQQGIDKGLMSADDVAFIHQKIQAQLAADGRTLDAFQVCPHRQSAGCGCRKPKAGLVLDWLGRHPTSEPSLSVVVGDSLSDLDMARNVSLAAGGCAGIQIGRANLGGVADATFDSLWDFAVAVSDAMGNQD